MTFPIENVYPSESELSKIDINEFPQMHFHFCYFGLQIFLVKSRGKYQVKTMNFVPTFIKHLDYKYVVSHTYLTIYESKDFNSAVYMYQKSCSDLLYCQNLKYLSGYDVADLTPIKYPREINIVRKVFC